MKNSQMPAMPIVTPYMKVEGSGGLTKLEWMAGMALNGFTANKERPTTFHPGQDAEYCVRLAKAILAELEKEK